MRRRLPTLAAICSILVLSVAILGRTTSTEGGTLVQFDVLVVVNTSDLVQGADGCSLREAILAANTDATSGDCVVGAGHVADEIEFNIGSSGTPTINVDGLPSITQVVIITGATGGATRVAINGPGSGGAPDGLVVQSTAAFTSLRNLVTSNFTGNHIDVRANDVTIVGSFIGTDATGTQDLGGTNGVRVLGAARTRIGGTSNATQGSCTGNCNLISGHFRGVFLETGSEPVVQGNFIGTNLAGTAAVMNSYGVESRISGALIGGTMAGAGNLISGNGPVGGAAVFVYSGGNAGEGPAIIQGNLLGLNAARTAAIPNADGIYVDGASDTLIGGTEALARNVISGNNRYGIDLCCGRRVIVFNNLIGTLPDGVTPLGNTSHGIRIREYSGEHRIGGLNAGEANTIAYSGGDGVRVDGEFYPADNNNNSIRGNSIFSNTGMGIETINGGNLELAPPVITSISSGTVTGTACALCEIDIFSDSVDEGRVYHGTETTDDGGNWEYDGPLTGPNITATAIDGANNTSEFSAPYALPASTPTPSPTPSPTATTTASPTSTPTTPNPTQGDVNCDNTIDEDDFVLLLLYAAGLDDGEQSGCLNLDDPESNSGFPWGDVNCDGQVNALDALFVVAFKAGVILPQSAGNCFPLGSVMT